MTTYRYKGIGVGGAETEGFVEAFDKQEAVIKARENCRVLLEVTPVRRSRVSDVLHADIGVLISGGRIKPQKLALLCSQLGIELRAGLPLVSALRLIAENEEDKRLKAMLEEVVEDVRAGKRLADSFSMRGPFLPRTFIESVRAGEESGRPDDCFDRLKEYYERSAAVRSKVVSAMLYPLLLLCVAVGVIAVILLKAVPVFEESFAAMGSALPLPTRILIGAGHFTADHVLLLLSVLLVLILAVVFYGRTTHGRHLYGRLGLTLPGLGNVNRMKAASQFASTLSTMLAAGLTLVQAVGITADVADNILVSEDIEKAVRGVIEGRRLGEGLRESRWFPPLLLEMTAVGEETGKLEETMTVVSEYYTKEVSVAVDRALSILEPVIVIVMALLVVFILLSVYLPMFGMYAGI